MVTMPRLFAPRIVIGAYAVAMLALSYHWPRFPSPNEYTRLYLLEALALAGGRGLCGGRGSSGMPAAAIGVRPVRVRLRAMVVVAVLRRPPASSMSRSSRVP